MTSRRWLTALIAAFILCGGVWAQTNSQSVRKMNESSSQSGTKSKRILVAYFSHTGNTREIANQIHDRVGGELFEIASVEPYPAKYDDVVKQAAKEQKDAARPKLKNKLEDPQSYDVIFVGYPNWWDSFPMPVATFLTENDFSGKTLIPFCTHGGSRMGHSVTDMAKLCPKSKMLEGLAIQGRSVKNANKDVADWLKKLGFSAVKKPNDGSAK